MSDKEKRPLPGTAEHWEWMRKRAEARGKQMAKAGAADFDEAGVLAGGVDSLTSTDAEAFPSDVTEYTQEERKPRIVPKKKD